MNSSLPDINARLRYLTSELRTLDSDLRSETRNPDLLLLQGFRQSLDDVRLTAWTVSELINARESKKNTDSMLSFLAAERLRRLIQIIRDLCADMDKQAFTWQTSGVHALSDSVILLQSRITKLIAKHRARIQRVGESGD